MLNRRVILGFVIALLAMPLLALAQPAGGPGGRGFGGPGGGPGGGGPGGGFGPGGQGGPGGGFNMIDQIKEQLGATDEEWSVLQPKVQKVLDAQRLVGTGRGGRGGRGGGPGGPGGGPGGPGGGNFGGGGQPPQANDPVSVAMSELRTTLQDTNAKAELITQKLTALRSAREKATADLTVARKTLKEVLTTRQEAVLVTLGVLE